MEDEKDGPKDDDPKPEESKPKPKEGRDAAAPKKRSAGGAAKVQADGMFKNFAGRSPPATAPRSWRFQHMKVTWYESLS